MPTAPRVRRSLGLLPMIAATFFMVSGGPYGLEDLVQKAGYARALIVLVVLPFIWSLPTALMVGELSGALPEEGGYYVWVRRALGPFWGFQEAWLSLLASIFDMAIYPTLFVLYLGQFAPSLGRGRNGLLVGAAVVATAALWNIAGIRAVGKSSVYLMLALLLPFAAMTVYAMWPAGSAVSHGSSMDFLGALSVAMWNYMGWDNASTIAGEVQDPQHTYPRAMIGAAVLVAVVYVIPVAAAMLAGIDASAWTTGAWVEAAGALGGRWLGLAVVAGGMICGLGMTNALVLSYTRVPFAMARDGFLPAAFLRVHPKTGAPWVSILACAVAWTVCLPLGFERLVLIDIILYGVALLLEFVALVVLRVREPDLPRRFRAPGGLVGAAALGVGPSALLVLTFVRGESERAGPVTALGLGAILGLLGVLVYFAVREFQPRISADERGSEQ
ncbi:MAG: APC family permease [Acidobacteriia bacterium]|nr:APC family permease [Terriglobia bacterium]